MKKVQEVLLDVIKKNPKGYSFKRLCEEAGENPRSVYNMLARESLRCDVLEKLLDVIDYTVLLMPKDAADSHRSDAAIHTTKEELEDALRTIMKEYKNYYKKE